MSQTEQILQMLKRGPVTPMDAFEEAGPQHHHRNGEQERQEVCKLQAGRAEART